MSHLEHNSIIAWLVANQIKTENGKDFDLRQHPFFYDILTDWSPNIVLLKAAQMGGTTAFSIKLLWAMKRHGLNCAYTMPTAELCLLQRYDDGTNGPLFPG